MVEAVCNKRQQGDQVQYRVQWEGYSPSKNTWENVENLLEARGAVARYEKNRKTKDDSNAHLCWRQVPFYVLDAWVALCTYYVL